jgi:hypothetical protein
MLTLCVYPMAIIMPEVARLTGLDNYNFIGPSRFNKNTGDVLKEFLSFFFNLKLTLFSN